MLNFKMPEISDKQWVESCLQYVKSLNCEYNFGNIYIWSVSYKTQICHYKDFCICRWGSSDDISYSLPLGKGNIVEAINQIIDDASKLGTKARIYGITEEYMPLFENELKDKFVIKHDDGMNDYIYSIEKMASLSGKKYHGKRNHISNFKKNNPNWCFEKLTKENLNDCINIHSKWLDLKEKDNEDIKEYSLEFESVLRAFEYFDELGLVGGLIRSNGEVIAYTIGEPHITKTCFVTHFEKANASIQGSYAIINQEFTKNCLSDFEYVNREEDLGIEGLRKSKQSYRPEIFLNKCMAEYNG